MIEVELFVGRGTSDRNIQPRLCSMLDKDNAGVAGRFVVCRQLLVKGSTQKHGQLLVQLLLNLATTWRQKFFEV